MKTDAQLKKDVADELEWDPCINATRIGISVENGVVTLSGEVEGYPEKLRAEEAVQRIAGVKGMAIELEVKFQGSTLYNDSDIANVARQALADSSPVSSEQVRVMVERGWVTLSGDVKWGYQADAAKSAVKHLKGVKGVINSIVVKPPIFPVDIKSKIEAALKRQAALEAKDIKVEIDGSTVTLRGKLHSWIERNSAIDAAWAAPGVSRVIDCLVIA